MGGAVANRPTGATAALGGSTTQEAFGADVEVAAPDVGLYLVVGHGDGRGLGHALNAAGARVAARISPTRLLAVLDISGFERLRADRAIALVGPVNLDPARFEIFQRVAGISAGGA